MSTLPHGILLIINSHLNRDELLQCQLTCRQWYKASLGALYTSLDIKSEEEAVLYVRTISESPALGECLKSIYFQNVFDQNGEGISLYNDSVLDTIIQRCPNITRMGNRGNKGFRFWNQLMHAATQGQLSNLKSLPRSCSADLKSYISTALLFKDSLDHLWLQDENQSLGYQLAQLREYQTLCDQIDQFKNLDSLVLSFKCDKRLDYFDGLIDKCHHLKELTFDLAMNDLMPPSETEQEIHPRPDIHTFVCNQFMIDDNIELEYVMRKFPNLKKFIVVSEGVPNFEEPHCSGPTLIKFIRYLLSIPEFRIEIEVNIEDLLNIWTELMKKKNGYKKLIVDHQCADFWNGIALSSEGDVSLSFPLEKTNMYDEGLPHIQFFSEFGRSIRSLVLRMSCNSFMTDEYSMTTDWLLDILRHCPLIEEVEIHRPAYVSPSYFAEQHPSVKKLTIDLYEYASTYHFLGNLSLYFPNLCQLSFGLYYVNQNFKGPIKIYMPQTSFDLLTWNETARTFGHFEATEVYIKLKTDAGTKFYVGTESGLFPSDAKCYKSYTRYTLRLDISCKQLKVLRVRRDGSPEFIANFVF